MPLSVARSVPAATASRTADPGLAHVVELQGAGRAVLEVADQLAQDPRLVGVGDAAELLLHDRLGQHLGPGQVVQCDLLELALVDLGRVLAGHGGDLVGDGQHRVEALLPGDVEVVLELLGLRARWCRS